MAPLTVGGVTPEQCGFNGLLTEVSISFQKLPVEIISMVYFLKVVMFEEPLGNAESQLVVTYLSEKYRIGTSEALGTSRETTEKKISAAGTGTIVEKPVITGAWQRYTRVCLISYIVFVLRRGQGQSRSTCRD